MPYPFFMSREACRQHRRLRGGLRARVDKVILGLRLVPTIGLYNRRTGNFAAHVGGDLRITYRVLTEPTTQIVILQIRPLNALREHLDTIGNPP